MKTAIYFCKCGTNISEVIDPEKVKEKICQLQDKAYFKDYDFLCSEEGEEFLKNDIEKENPDRVVIAACSPRDYESTFMRIVSEAGMNPYLMQMVNLREQVAWVTEDKDKAACKALAQIRGSLSRVQLHEPMTRKSIDVTPDVLIIGAGPAGYAGHRNRLRSDTVGRC